MVPRIIRDQTIAGTRLDSHGERIDREHLTDAFSHMPDELVMHTEHDAARHPVCRAFNQRLVERSDGELAIVADIEVFDEEAFSRFGGFSIGFLGRTHRLGSGDLRFNLLLNPRQFDLDQVKQDLSPLLPEGQAAEITEYHQKAALPPLATILFVFLAAALVSAVNHTWAGFWNAAGARIFERTRTFKRKDDPAAPTATQIQLRTEHDAKLVIAVAPEVTPDEIREVDLPAIATWFLALSDLESVERIVGTLKPGPSLQLEFLVRLDGSVEDPPTFVDA